MKRSARWFGCLGILVFLAGVARAQVTTGTLLGRVVDQSGLGVPGAEVRAVNELTSTSKRAITDEAGTFTLTFLPVGRYTITVSMPGFKTLTQRGLEISSGQKLDVTYTLEVGELAETITVSSEAPLLNTVSPEQDIKLSTEQLSRLPVSRRDFSQLLLLGTGTGSGGGQISLNGLPPRGFTFSIDGVDASPDHEYNSMAMYQDFNYIKGVSMDAIQEVEVSKNVFSAEIGQTVSGNVNLITKSGTNQFHGSAFEYYQSGGLMAVNHFVPRKAPQVFHQFGGSLGGPIVRDKVFFFAVYEGYRLNAKQPQSGFVPSRWLRDQLTGVLPGADKYFSLWPLPTEPENAGDVRARYSGVHSETRDDDHFSIRGDYNLTDRDFVTGRFTLADPDRLQPRLVLGNPRDRRGSTRNVSTAYTRSWTPSVTSEFRFGYNRSSVDRIDLIWEAKVPDLVVANSPGTDGELFIKKGSSSSFENTWSWSGGRHAMKFGGLLRWHRGGRINEEVPQYEFDTVAAARANRADSATFQFILEEFQIRNHFVGFFLQDDLRLTPSFILNLGLRWDYSGVPRERDGRFFNRAMKPFDPLAPDSIGPWLDPDRVWNSNWTDFSPRIGFAWTLDQSKKTVLRGGYGIFFIPFNLFAGPVEIVKNGLNEPVEAEFRSPDALQALNIRYPNWNDTVKPKVAGSGIDADSKIHPDWDSSYSQQWSLGIQREITRDTVLDIAYVGNHGTKLIYSPVVNQPMIRFNGPGWVGFTGADPPLPQDNGFRLYMTADSSVYHSLQATLKKRFSRDFSYDVAYTWASNLSHFQSDFTCCGAGELPQDIFDMASNRGPTPYHLRHRLTVDALWEIPWLNSTDDPALRHLLGGWSINGVLNVQSGDPLLISQSGTRTQGARPDFVGSSHKAALLSNWNRSQDGSRGCTSLCYFYLDPSAFAPAPTTRITDREGNSYTVLARPGTMGRRSIYGPGEWTVDLSLAKSFAVTEGSRIQVRADLFNALNHTNLGNPQTNIRSRFGQITSASAGRVVQLTLRYDF